MLENDFRKLIQGAVEKEGGHLSWIESHMTSAGFPDADFCVNGVLVQAELKVKKANGDLEIRPTQYRWFKDRVAAGGRPVMLIGTDHGFWFVHGNSVNHSPEHKGNPRLHHMEQLANNPSCVHVPTVERLIELCVAWCDPT